ncbi:carbohydrate kinase family protein [Sneathiella sp. P13V-1]|uniref:carbohydrate kinase family protein n=1 Tax=Sneathiella sp. P13V-1 TaxID=2697366 RepID=UPI00187B9AE2|nr:carbohydrate kinase family protein [Sneathiella sp. P13V-1]MBE7636507.1 carbohydrate kinase family protein [Sneathiella sp. P13V-1]
MKVLVIGGATIDVITSIDTEDIECITMRNATNSFLMLEQGKKVEAQRIDNQVGGGATNAAVAMSRLGGDVSAVLKLGDDMYATRVLERLADEKVDTRYVVKMPGEQTGKSIIISSHDKNAGVFVHRGANTTLSMDDVTPEMFDGVDLVYISTLSSNSANAFLPLVKLAKSKGCFVACNPGIRQIRNRKEQMFDALQYLDLMAINKEEATALAEGMTCSEGFGCPHEGQCPELIRHGLGDKDAEVSLEYLSRKILEAGCQNFTVTNGGEGAYLASGNLITFRPSVKVEVESTIGAGDAFNATLAFSLASGMSAADALTRAAINGASVAGMLDTQGGLLTKDEMSRRETEQAGVSAQEFVIQ